MTPEQIAEHRLKIFKGFRVRATFSKTCAIRCTEEIIKALGEYPSAQEQVNLEIQVLKILTKK